MAIYECGNCLRIYQVPVYYDYCLSCPECFGELRPMYFPYVVPPYQGNDFGSKNGNFAVPPTYLCSPYQDQMINSPMPVNYGQRYEQMPPHMEHNGQPFQLPQPLPQTAPSYSNSSNGSVVHSINSAEGSEAQSFVNDLSPIEIPGNNRATECLKSLTALLKVNVYFSQPMRRKLGKLINCPLSNEENQIMALNFCFSFGERVIFELMRDNQNLQDSPSNLLASIRSKGCQFLGVPMQDEILKLILQALEGGENITRKELVTFVLERLQQHRQTSKKKIGDVVQLLYRACCFNITKRQEMSAQMQLKENLREYKTLREQHDAQVVQIATDAGIRISTDNWALLLYNDVNYKPYMDRIIEEFKSKTTFYELVKQFEMFAQRRSNIDYLKRFCAHLKILAEINESKDPEFSTEKKITKALDEVYKIVREYKNRERAVYPEDQYPRNQSTKQRNRFCRDYTRSGKCPRGNGCKFEHPRAGYNYNRNIS